MYLATAALCGHGRAAAAERTERGVPALSGERGPRRMARTEGGRAESEERSEQNRARRARARRASGESGGRIDAV